MTGSPYRFSEPEIEAVYRTIFARRDVRRFVEGPISDDTLARLLDAAHHAPSVGFSQPWRFLVIREPETRARVKELFEAANRAAAERYSGERARLYRSLKLEGICEAPINLCIACTPPPTSDGPVLGAQTMPETLIYSACLAIQNLWLAARAEGLGVGWVSIVDPARLGALLGVPPEARLIAYLCLGVPESLPDEPMLKTVGWRDRSPLSELVYVERWGNFR